MSGIRGNIKFDRLEVDTLIDAVKSVYKLYTRILPPYRILFAGYPEVSEKDGDSQFAAVGGYAMPENYDEYLSRVLETHEHDNVMDHVRKFELVKGEAGESLKHYLIENPETVVALAYLDMAMYESTRDVLELLLPHMVKGGVIALDELGSSKFPGETRAFKEVIGTGSFHMARSQFLPDRTIVTVE